MTSKAKKNMTTKILLSLREYLFIIFFALKFQLEFQ